MRWLIACLLLIASPASADFIELKELSIDAIQFFPSGIEPLISWNGQGRAPDKQLDLNMNAQVAKVVYWDNRVHSMTDKTLDGTSSQFRVVGWNFRIGVQFSEQLQVGYYHFSKHLLDHSFPGGAFPVLDGVEVKWYLFGGKNGNR